MNADNNTQHPKCTRNMLHDQVGKRLGGVDMGDGVYYAYEYDQGAIAGELYRQYELLGNTPSQCLADIPDEIFNAVASRYYTPGKSAAINWQETAAAQETKR